MHRLVMVSLACCAALVGTTEAQWLNHPTPGIPRLSDGRPNLSAPTPRAGDGRPDLSGLWEAECIFSSACWSQSRFFDLAGDAEAPMTPWAAAIQQQREGRGHVDDPVGYCLPNGYPRMAFPSPFKILQTSNLTAFLHESIPGPLFRQVFTDGRPHPPDAEPTWMGYSVGHWEGEVFVVETTGFRDRGWLDTRKARPHSDALRVIERFARTSFGNIDWTITIDDPKAFLKSWSVHARLRYLADSELLEGFCDNHDKTMEHRRITAAPPEPPSPAITQPTVVR